MADEPVNFFDLHPGAAAAGEPPSATSEADYGENVVSLPPRKRGHAGWKKEWHASEAGTPLTNLFNVMIALRNHPKLAGLVSYDDMACSPMIRSASGLRRLTDADVLIIQEELQRTGLRRVPKGTVEDGLDYCASENRYHPVRQYLSGLAWDGTKRVHKWLSYYLGVEFNDYSSTIGRLFLIALVARVMQPGCKADYMLILEGPQGVLKSSACRVIAGEWFSDSLPDLARGDAVRVSMHLRGKWLIEIGELSSFNAAESHTLKEFLTQTEERYTPKYARQEVYEPRQCLFIGSTNEDTYLKDATGARRFWPVKVDIIDLVALAEDRDQLLAEALSEFQSGAHWWPDRAFEAEHIAPQQEARYDADPWEEAIETWIGSGWRLRVSVNEVLKDVIGMDVSKIGTREQRRVSAVLRRLGWLSKRSNGKKFYEKG
jgi:predicted P-loop ATPase